MTQRSYRSYSETTDGTKDLKQAEDGASEEWLLEAPPHADIMRTTNVDVVRKKASSLEEREML